jgi:large subunit ribosomal protein L7/L12
MAEQTQEAATTGAVKSGKVASIVEAIKALSLLEAVELKKALEQEFGVTAMPAMVAAAPGAAGAAAAGGAAPAAVEEQTSFNVVLKTFTGDKIKVIKAVRSVTTLGLKEAKALVESLPQVVRESVPKDEADKIKAQLVEAGGEVELK